MTNRKTLKVTKKAARIAIARLRTLGFDADHLDGQPAGIATNAPNETILEVTEWAGFKARWIRQDGVLTYDAT